MIVEKSEFRLGMTPQERAAHRPGWGVATNGIGKPADYLNRSRSLADVYDIRLIYTGNKGASTWRWFLAGTKTPG